MPSLQPRDELMNAVGTYDGVVYLGNQKVKMVPLGAIMLFGLKLNVCSKATLICK